MSLENKSISTVLALAACVLSLAANADRHWTGGGATTDWTDNANWGAGNGSGNWVFGGAKVANLPSTDPIVCTFSNAVTISSGVWIENGSKANVVWRASENADEGAGLKTTWGTNNSLNIGTGTHGGLTIESGVYYMPKQLWIGNGAADSYFTLNGGVFTNQSYTCIGYGGYSRTATMTVNGGTFRQNGDKFIIGQGNNIGCIGIYNQTGGEVSVPEIFMSENKGSSSLTVSGGSFSGGTVSAPRGGSTKADVSLTGGTQTFTGDFRLGYGASSEGTLVIDGATVEATSNFYAGYGQNSTANIEIKSGMFDTDNEFILSSATGSTTDMRMSGGTFTPKKLWIASHWNQTSSGCNATFTMTGGTLTTDNDQDIVVGGNANAVGTFNMQGGTVNCGNTFHIAWNGSGTLNMSGGDIYLRSGKNLYFAEHGTSATMNFTGGTVHTDNIVMGTGDSGNATTSLTVNGGSFAPVTDKADWLSGVTVSVGANGIGFDTDGHATTFAGTIVNADGVTGNVPLMKKGTGTLTVPLDLDLARTFKFVINGDVGPIALTGEGNTLGVGAKIAVEVDIVDFELGTKYVLLTGLDAAFTLDDSFNLPDDNGFCTLEWSLEDGELSVTPVGYVSGAPVTARYVNSGWTFYDGNDEAIENGEASQYTSYVFTGVEPAGELASIAGAHNVIFEARRDGETDVVNTISLTSAVTAGRIAVKTDDGCEVRITAADDSANLSVSKFVNDGDVTILLSDIALGEILLESGTCKFSGGNTYLIPVPVSLGDGGTLEIGADSEVSLDATGDVFLAFKLAGTGALRIKSGSGIAFNDTYMNDFTGTVEVPAGAWCGAEKNGNRLKTGTCKFRFAGGTAWFNGGNRNEFANDVEFVEGTSSKILAGASNFIFEGDVSGSGEFTVEVNDRGVEFIGDNREFSGIANLNYGWPPNNMWNAFYHWNSASSSARWNLNCSHSGWYNKATRNSYVFRDTSAENPMRFGALNVSASSTTITLNQETYVTVGERENDSSTINGRFVDNVVRLTKVGADSWLKLGTTFQMVDGSTLTVSAGGLAFNLPTDDTVTDLTGDTVTIDPSVKLRVNMTAAQSAILDKSVVYTVAKLPAASNPGIVPVSEVTIDGVPAASKEFENWKVRFKNVAAVGDDPAYVAVTFSYIPKGFVIIIN